MSIYVRTNGRGNAWPIPLGKEHPFYNRQDVEDMANASFSIIKSSNKNKIEKEIVIDAGHGAIQYLLKHGNRIPEALFLTHPHIDHTLSVDWIVQSHWRQRGKKYPLYANPLCWEQTLISFPQLEKMVDFRALLPAKSVRIPEFDDLIVRFYPVFHGESAAGAGMLLFEYGNKKMLFTGDILIPLLRKTDLEYLQNCHVVYTDANNRYPYPNSNHWSVLRPELIGEKKSKFLTEWLQNKARMYDWLIRPNLPLKFNKITHEYFNDFLSEIYVENKLILSVFDFAKQINAQKIFLLHYSGGEDFKHYGKEIMDSKNLQQFVNAKAKQIGMDTVYIVPKVGNWEYIA